MTRPNAHAILNALRDGSADFSQAVIVRALAATGDLVEPTEAVTKLDDFVLTEPDRRDS
jgi:hypothetical protein